MPDQAPTEVKFRLFSESVADRPEFQHIKNLEHQHDGHHTWIQLANFAQFSMTLVSIRPGESLPRHSHPGAHHAIYVIEGRGTARIEDREYSLTPGAFLIIPQGVFHCTTNTGSGDFKYVQMLVPV